MPPKDSEKLSRDSMMQALQQDFSALTSRDKMRFLRWAAESVGARLDTVFGSIDLPVNGGTGASSSGDAKAALSGEAEIPEFLKR